MEKIVENAQTGTKKGAIEQEIINRGRGHRCIHENTDHSSIASIDVRFLYFLENYHLLRQTTS